MNIITLNTVSNNLKRFVIAGDSTSMYFHRAAIVHKLTELRIIGYTVSTVGLNRLNMLFSTQKTKPTYIVHCSKGYAHMHRQ